jgi:hypothetical protein
MRSLHNPKHAVEVNIHTAAFEAIDGYEVWMD